MIWPLQPICYVRPFIGYRSDPLIFLWPVPVYEHINGMARFSWYWGPWTTGVEFHYTAVP